MRKLSQKTVISLIFILLLASILRLWQLGAVPGGISNDEAGYMYSAYSIWKTGYDVAGRFLPLSINLDNSFSPVYIYATSPFVGIMGLSPFFGRLPFALVSILSVGVLFLLTYEFTKNKIVALLSSLLIAISPWHLQLSRGALDADFALFFYLAGMWVFIHYSRNRKLLYSLPLFLLAYYSYHATKIFFILLIPIMLIYCGTELLKQKNTLYLFLAGCIFIVISFFYISSTQSVTRQQVLLTNDFGKASQVVDQERKYNSAPAIIQKLFSNKLLYFGRIFRENYLQAFSPQYLFLYGEPSGLKKQYSMLSSGELYILELPFLLIGIYAIIRSKKNLLPLIFLLIAPAPSALSSDVSYINRSIMMLPFLLMITAIGIWFAYKNIKVIIYRYGFVIAVIGFFIFLFSEYLYTYYFRYPFLGAEAWRVSSKEVSLYASQKKKIYRKVYIDGSNQMFVLQYAFWNRVDPSLVKIAWKGYPANSSIGNVFFVSKCSYFPTKTVKENYKEKNILVIAPKECYMNDQPYKIFVDSGEVLQSTWKVYRQ